MALDAPKVRDCAALATDAARAGLEQVGQVDAQRGLREVRCTYTRFAALTTAARRTQLQRGWGR